MPSKHLTLSLALAGLSGIAAAADSTFLDGRLNLGIIPGPRGAEYGGSVTTDDSAKVGFGAAVGVECGRFFDQQFGWVAGASLIDGASKGTAKSATDSDLKETHFGVQINAGAAFKVTKEIHVELTPFFGVGRAKTTIVGANDGADASASGTYLDYGISLGGFYTWDDHLQLGIDIGYEGFSAHSTPSVNLGGFGAQTIDVKVKGGGLMAGVSLGYRF